MNRGILVSKRAIVDNNVLSVITSPWSNAKCSTDQMEPRNKLERNRLRRRVGCEAQEMVNKSYENVGIRIRFIDDRPDGGEEARVAFSRKRKRLSQRSGKRLKKEPKVSIFRDIQHGFLFTSLSSEMTN
jgi:hypothetical protein